MDTIVMNGREARERADESTMVLSTLMHARRIFSDLANLLAVEMDRLHELAKDEKAEDRLKTVLDLSDKLRRATQTVTEIEVKLMKQGEAAIPGRTVIDLEAARAEVARRLDRLAA